MIKHIRRVYNFIMHSRNKLLYLRILYLSAFFRLLMLLIPMKFYKKYLGKQNEESADEETTENYHKAFKLSRAVNKVCSLTPWESKCLVRALTVQHLLKKSNISSTLYLGVGKKEDSIVAHAWIRSGSNYLSGGNGMNYASVAKFRA